MSIHWCPKCHKEVCRVTIETMRKEDGTEEQRTHIVVGKSTILSGASKLSNLSIGCKSPGCKGKVILFPKKDRDSEEDKDAKP